MGVILRDHAEEGRRVIFQAVLLDDEIVAPKLQRMDRFFLGQRMPLGKDYMKRIAAQRQNGKGSGDAGGDEGTVYGAILQPVFQLWIAAFEGSDIRPGILFDKTVDDLRQPVDGHACDVLSR